MRTPARTSEDLREPRGSAAGISWRRLRSEAGPHAEGHPQVVRHGVGLGRQRIAGVKRTRKMVPDGQAASKADASKIKMGFLTRKGIEHGQLPGVAEEVDAPIAHVLSHQADQRRASQLEGG